MTVIDRIAAPAAPVRATSASRTRGTFAVPDGSQMESGEAAAVAAPELTTLLGLQESEPASERKSRAQRRAREMLAGLAALQRTLVAGADTAAALHELSARHADPEPTGDPVLDDLVRSIGLRVRIELARHGL